METVVVMATARDDFKLSHFCTTCEGFLTTTLMWAEVQHLSTLETLGKKQTITIILQVLATGINILA